MAAIFYDILKEHFGIPQRTPSARHNHVAVCMNRDIVVFGGIMLSGSLSHRFIWIYRHDIDRWKKYVIPKTHTAPTAMVGACAVAIGTAIYVHGGIGGDWGNQYIDNDLWRLSRRTDHGITWSKIHFENDHVQPSPRYWHAGWEHDDKLWIFGGLGPPLTGFLSENGHYLPDHITAVANIGYNNQLHCFDPASQTWTNVKCTGTIPSPRAAHAVAKGRDTAWLYGGFDVAAQSYSSKDDLFGLCVHTKVWTRITTNGPVKPLLRCGHSFTAVGENQIILFGGCSKVDVHVGDELHLSLEKSTWILDLHSLSWTEHTGIMADKRACHTGSSDGRNVIIFGGFQTKYGHCFNDLRIYSDVFPILLEPKSLWKLALQTVHEHRASLKTKWHELPRQYQVHLADMHELGRPDKMNTGTAVMLPRPRMVHFIKQALVRIRVVSYSCVLVWRYLVLYPGVLVWKCLHTIMF